MSTRPSAVELPGMPGTARVETDEAPITALLEVAPAPDIVLDAE